ncbi:MAG: S-layer homology domain-containing protein [Anaerovoracaceae bacterium]
MIRKIKKWACALTAVLIGASITFMPGAQIPVSNAAETPVVSYALSLSDTYGTPFYDAVSQLAAAGIITGYSDGTFRPYNTLSRAEACTLIYKAYGDDSYSPYNKYNFEDLSESYWGYKYIDYCAGIGIVSGYPDGTFRPDNTVTYDELISMIVRAQGLNDGQVLSYPSGYISLARQNGILDNLSGVTINSSNNSSPANRGNTAIMIASGDYNSTPADDPIEDLLADRNMTGVVYGIVTKAYSGYDSTGDSCVIAKLLIGNHSYDIVPYYSLSGMFSNMTAATGLVRITIKNGRAMSVTKVTFSYNGSYGMVTPAASSSDMTAFCSVDSISSSSLSYTADTSGSVYISSSAVFYRIALVDGNLTAYNIEYLDISEDDMAAAYSVSGTSGTTAEIIISIQSDDFDDILHQSDNPDFRLMG